LAAVYLDVLVSYFMDALGGVFSNTWDVEVLSFETAQRLGVLPAEPAVDLGNVRQTSERTLSGRRDGDAVARRSA
jgi:hypothetical protein